MTKILKSVLLAIVGICTVSLSSCKPSVKQIIEKGEAASFTVYTYDEYGSPSGSGSGFFIASDGTAVTNWHVLDGCVKAVIKTSEGKEFEIDSVLCASSKKDILVFRVKNPQNVKFKKLKFADDLPAKGGKVYNISSPHGLEASFSEGIVSSYREDSHGRIVQTTAPVSPGSSGSPLLDEYGKVFAITTFKIRGTENVNFCVIMDENFREELDDKAFYKSNKRFNSEKTDFVLLNIMPDMGSDIVLNAIEFSPTATTLYLSFTNMHLTPDGSGWKIWAGTGKKDKGLYIEDTDNNHRYYMTSSTLATSRNKAEAVGIGEVLQFKVHFPVIKHHLSNINVMWGEGDRNVHFTSIDLDAYRNQLALDEVGYQRALALKYTHEGALGSTIETLSELLDEYPSDAISLNMMAILYYLLDNNTSALLYIEEAIEQNPNDVLAYLNRAAMLENSKKYKGAIEDLTSAVNISPENPEYYYARARNYYNNDQYQEALADMKSCLEKSDSEDGFASNPYFYELRGHIYYQLNDKKSSESDIRKAYKLSTDSDLDKRLNLFFKLYL